MDMRAIVVLICILAVIGAVIYYLAYQRYLRKALNDPAAARHQSLPAPDNTVAVTAVILGFAMLMLISNNIRELTGSIDNINKNINNGNAYSYQLSNIENELHQQRSILAYHYIYEDETESTAEISVIPKIVTKTTKVTVYNGKVAVVLTRGEGAEFTGKLPLTEIIGEEPNEYIISIETDGIIETECVR